MTAIPIVVGGPSAEDQTYFPFGTSWPTQYFVPSYAPATVASASADDDTISAVPWVGLTSWEQIPTCGGPTAPKNYAFAMSLTVAMAANKYSIVTLGPAIFNLSRTGDQADPETSQDCTIQFVATPISERESYVFIDPPPVDTPFTISASWDALTGIATATYGGTTYTSAGPLWGTGWAFGCYTDSAGPGPGGVLYSDIAITVQETPSPCAPTDPCGRITDATWNPAGL